MNTEATDAWRQRLGPLVLVFIVVGVIMLLADKEPIRIDIAYQVPPTLRAAPRNIKRTQIAEIRTTFFTEKRERAGVMTLTFPHGLRPPVTHTGSIRLPAGNYILVIVVKAQDGRELTRRQPLEIAEAGLVEVPIK